MKEWHFANPVTVRTLGSIPAIPANFNALVVKLDWQQPTKLCPERAMWVRVPPSVPFYNVPVEMRLAKEILLRHSHVVIFSGPGDVIGSINTRLVFRTGSNPVWGTNVTSVLSGTVER